MSAFSEVVIIDDEALLRRVIEALCRELELPARSFTSVADFMASDPTVSPDALFLVDSQLGEELGEESSLALTERGFRKIYICTGRDTSAVTKPPHVRGYVAKDMTILREFLTRP